MRPISVILEDEKKCQPGVMTKEICELAYKMRNDIPLTEEEQELKEAYFTIKFIKVVTKNGRKRKIFQQN